MTFMPVVKLATARCQAIDPVSNLVAAIKKQTPGQLEVAAGDWHNFAALDAGRQIEPDCLRSQSSNRLECDPVHVHVHSDVVARYIELVSASHAAKHLKAQAPDSCKPSTASGFEEALPATACTVLADYAKHHAAQSALAHAAQPQALLPVPQLQPAEELLACPPCAELPDLWQHAATRPNTFVQACSSSARTLQAHCSQQLTAALAQHSSGIRRAAQNQQMSPLAEFLCSSINMQAPPADIAQDGRAHQNQLCLLPVPELGSLAQQLQQPTFWDSFPSVQPVPVDANLNCIHSLPDSFIAHDTEKAASRKALRPPQLQQHLHCALQLQVIPNIDSVRVHMSAATPCASSMHSPGELHSCAGV